MLPQRWRLEWPDVLLGAIQSIAPRDGISRSGESLTPKFVFLLLPGMGCSSRREHFDVQISSSSYPWGDRFHSHLRSHSSPSSSSSHTCSANSGVTFSTFFSSCFCFYTLVFILLDPPLHPQRTLSRGRARTGTIEINNLSKRAGNMH